MSKLLHETPTPSLRYVQRGHYEPEHPLSPSDGSVFKIDPPVLQQKWMLTEHSDDSDSQFSSC
jgi:hypothetical protein